VYIFKKYKDYTLGEHRTMFDDLNKFSMYESTTTTTRIKKHIDILRVNFFKIFCTKAVSLSTPEFRRTWSITSRIYRPKNVVIKIKRIGICLIISSYVILQSIIT